MTTPRLCFNGKGKIRGESQEFQLWTSFSHTPERGRVWGKKGKCGDLWQERHYKHLSALFKQLVPRLRGRQGTLWLGFYMQYVYKSMYMSIPVTVGLINMNHSPFSSGLMKERVIWQSAPQHNRIKQNIHTKARNLMRHFAHHCRWAQTKIWCVGNGGKTDRKEREEKEAV